MAIQVKICGLSTPETLDMAIHHGASHVGFVFFAKSPRNLTLERAASLAARVPAHVKTVGVFVDPAPDFLDRVRASVKLDVLQLHGIESPETAARIGKNVEVWKAVAVRTRADLARANAYRGSADRILFDAKTPENAELPGGMGVRFDWKLLHGHRHALPWALSGGLDAGNLAEAVRATGATLLDVSSGVESAPGIKDVDKIGAFLKAASTL